MFLHVLSSPLRGWRKAVPLLLLAAPGLVPIHAQTAVVAVPKKTGTVRIGLLLPKNGLAGGGNLQDGEPVREAEKLLLTGPTFESVELQAVVPELAMAEAKQLNCDYLLNTTLSQQKPESGGRFGKLMNMRAVQMASSGAVFLPGSSNAKQIGVMGGQLAQQQLATATQGVKANNDISLQYTLTSIEGTVALNESAKVRSKSDGENVLTPLLTEAAAKIVAVAKPISVATAATPSSLAPAAAAGSVPAPAAALVTYGNYDFIPGDKPVFVDDFRTTQDGEFPEKWELLKGQGTVNQQAGYPSFVINGGDPAKMKPRITQSSYLGKQFTLEFDLFGVESQWGPTLYFNSNPSEDNPSVMLRTSKAVYMYPGEGNIEGNYPEQISIQNFFGKWHHIAVSYKEPQLKVYVDQYRVLYLPDSKFAPQAIAIGGITSPSTQVVFRNVRLATGGGSNYVGKQFTDAKIVTHGINFDLDKATLRPESMGVLNQIAKLMTTDPSLKFEIDGHTDNSGTTPRNLELSDQRAAAVKSQLLAMGIDGSRLTTKGLGDTQPLGPNDTPEGQANNRRVEFIRK